MSKLFFLLMIGFIAGVASFDVYCSMKTSNTLLAMERNPVGRYLINLDNGDIALFMSLKLVGISFVIVLLYELFYYYKRIGVMSTFGVAVFQTWLVFQLMS